METRQNARRIPAQALHDLQDYLSHSSTPLSIDAALTIAIREWLAHQPALMQPHRGYQWKQLFLPAGTELRMYHQGRHHYAKVVAEQLIYESAALTPRGMTLAIAGIGRNAWRDLWIRLPHERDWVNAALLRKRHLASSSCRPRDPAEALSTATAAMNQALQAAVALIEHVDHQSQTMLERRLPKHRRAYDQLEEVD